jgi:hypothetical protein
LTKVQNADLVMPNLSPTEESAECRERQLRRLDPLRLVRSMFGEDCQGPNASLQLRDHN